MRRLLWACIATSQLAFLACGADSPTSAPNFSINGKGCTKTRNVTADGQGGPTMADKTIALTFDDGPSEYTAELSAYLHEQNVAATFFINGVNATGREKVLDQQVTDGHLLANHTQTHASLVGLASPQLLDEISATDAVLASRVPSGKLYFRPPFGEWDENVMKTISGSAMQKYAGPVLWDIGDAQTESTAADWDCWEDNGNGTRSVKECGDLYLKEIEAKKKGIVLMHDGPPDSDRDKTITMVKYLVPLLKAEGYSFARIDQVPLSPLTAPVTADAPGREPGAATTTGGTAAPVGVDPCK